MMSDAQVFMGPPDKNYSCELCEEKINKGYAAVLIKDVSTRKIFCSDCGVFKSGLMHYSRNFKFKRWSWMNLSNLLNLNS